MNVEGGDIETPTNLLRLADLSRWLKATVGPMPSSYVLGKTVLRDHVMERLDCSALRAEQIVDRLVAEGFVGFHRRHPGPLARRARWRFS